MSNQKGKNSDPGACLRGHIFDIIDLWKREARAAGNPASHESESVLVNSMPDFLEHLAESLEAKHKIETPCQRTDVCLLHGVQRAELTRSTLRNVLHEYSLLRRVLLKYLSAHCRIAAIHRDLVHLAIDEAMQDAASAFVGEKTKTEQNKIEKAEGKVRQLEADSDMRDRFISTLSHDLRGPLSSVKMALDLMLQEVPHLESVRELASIMVRGINKSEGLLNDLLDINRINSGVPIELDQQFFNLKNLLSEVVLDLIPIYGNRLVLNAPANALGFWSRSHISRMIDNLVSNAVKYGDEKTPITISLNQTEAEVSVAVHNFGNPIPKAEQKSLFQPYYRSKSVNIYKTKGWGLGLTLVKAVAEAHGGRVEVKSSAEEGTTFTIYLPKDGRENPSP